MEPTRLFPIIVLLSLVTVEYGGWALLRFVTGHGTLGAFRERFFAAGHAHAVPGEEPEQRPAAVLDGDQRQQHDDREQPGGFHAQPPRLG